jgi:hypothetical protein
MLPGDMARALREELEKGLEDRIVFLYDLPFAGGEVCNLSVYRNELYAFISLAGEIWKTSDGKEWTRLYQYPTAAANGARTTCWACTVFSADRKLYYGGIRFSDAKGIILRTDGETVEESAVIPPALGGDAEVYAICEFNGRLYIGTGEGRVLRSSDGENFTEVLNIGVSTSPELFAFGGYIYAVSTATPGTVYRSSSGDPGTWSSVATIPLTSTQALRSHNPRLVYAGKAYLASNDLEDYLRVVSTPDGVNWSEEFTLPVKRGNQDGRIAGRVKACGDYLFLTSMHYGGSAALNNRGGQLWVYDGYMWTRLLTLPCGIGDVELFKGRLYVGTAWSPQRQYISLDKQYEYVMIRALSLSLPPPPPRQAYFKGTDGTVWNNASISAGDTTYGVICAGYGKKSIYFLSSVAGVLTVQVREPGGDWRNYDSIKVNANELTPYIITGDFEAFRLTFDTAATVTAWYVLG